MVKERNYAEKEIRLKEVKKEILELNHKIKNLKSERDSLQKFMNHRMKSLII